MSLYTTTLLSDVPIAYWRLGESSGTSAADSSGNARNGTYVNTPALGLAGLVAGENNAAAKFASASSQCVNCGNNAAFTLTSPFTLEAWIKPTNVTGTFQVVLAKSDGNVNANFELRFDSATGKLQLVVANSVGSFFTIDTLAALSNGQVYHVVGVYEGANLLLYLNGILQGQTPVSGTLATTTEPLAIAARALTAHAPGQFFFDGTIDEVAIYASALSGGRILAHYTAGVSSGVGAPVVGASTIRGR